MGELTWGSPSPSFRKCSSLWTPGVTEELGQGLVWRRRGSMESRASRKGKQESWCIMWLNVGDQEDSNHQSWWRGMERMGWDALSVRGGPKYGDFKAGGTLTTLPLGCSKLLFIGSLETWEVDWGALGWETLGYTLGLEALPPELLLKQSGLHHLPTKPQSILLAISLPPTFRVLMQ